MRNPIHALHIGIVRGLPAIYIRLWYIITLKWIKRDKTSENE